MSLFKKIEIKPEMEPFIAQGEGVGVVKVANYGKASARIESHKIILESYDEEYPIIESIAAISYLSYDPGNFFQEPKLGIGLGNKEYTLAGVDNNDEELEAFYKSILRIKNNEKKQNIKNNIQPQVTDKQNDNIDELDELEEELDKKPSTKDTTNKIKGFLSKRFEDKEEKITPKEENVSNNVDPVINKKTEEPNDLELILDDEDIIEDDDDEEIIFLKDEQEEEKPPKETIQVQEKEEIEDIEEYDEFDEFDEIDDFEELDDFEVEEEVLIEEDTTKNQTLENKVKEDKIEEKTEPAQPVQQEVTKEPENNKETNDAKNINENNDNEVTETKEELNEIQESKVEPEKTSDQKLNEESIETKPEIKVQNNNETKLDQEISKVKKEVNENLDNLNQDIADQETINKESTDTFDPVYQIRRYYELKNEGIITEEEFNQKKKQLLEL